jgi:beta-alanine degradation protein BauB
MAPAPPDCRDFATDKRLRRPGLSAISRAGKDGGVCPMTEISSVSRPPATPTVQVDNERVKVTEWRFAPGAETRWHRHGNDYVVVPLTTGKLLLHDGRKDTLADLTAGRSYYRPVGVEHNVINANAFEFTFIEIEFKTPA